MIKIGLECICARHPRYKKISDEWILVSVQSFLQVFEDLVENK